MPPGLVQALQEPEAMELFLFVGRGPAPDERVFHGHGVLEQRTIDMPEMRARVARDVLHGLQSPGDSDGFLARHGLRLRGAGLEYELLLSFEHGTYLAFSGGEEVGRGRMADTARPVFEELMGPVRDRLLSGHTFDHWAEHSLTRWGGMEEVPAAESPGLVALAEMLAWEGWCPCKSWPDRLSPQQQALVAPILARHLGDDSIAWAWPEVLELLARCGPDAAAAVPALEALTRRRDLPALSRRSRYRGYDPYYLRQREGRPAGFDFLLVRERARQALSAISKQPENR